MFPRSLLALALLLAACPASHDTDADAVGPTDPVTPTTPTTPTTPATPTTPTTPTTDEAATGPDTWTAGIVTEKRAGIPGRVTAVRAGRHEGFDRVVFEFAGDAVPGWHLEYVDKPARQCASGEPVEVKGDGLLLVQLSPSSAHDDAGAVTVPQETLPALPNVLEIERTCDFEAITAWIVGVGSPNPYRVFELSAPPRLVVDIKQ